MDRADIIRLLPCYRAGQLEGAEADRVRRALHDDPSLRELLATIQDAERLCAATHRRGAPADLRGLGPAPAAGPRTLAGIWSLLAAVVVTVTLILCIWTQASNTEATPELDPLERLLHAAWIGSQEMIEERHPGELQGRLLAAGAPAVLCVMEALGSQGLALEGAIWDGERVARVWVGPGGDRVVTVTGAPIVIQRTPDRVSRPDEGSGPTLQGHQLPGYGLVYWEEHGLGHALLARSSLDGVTEIAARLLWEEQG